MSVYIFAIILLITTLFEAIEGLISTRKYIEKEVTQTQRIKIYKSTILWGWIKTLLCILLFTLLKFPLKEAGFILPKFISENVHFLFGILVYIVSIGLFLMLTYQIIMFRVSSNYRIALSKVMEKKGKMKGVDVMLPTTGLEKKLFRLCAITAGFCEEIVFRAFLFYIINQILPKANSYHVLVFGSLIFGIAHMYQGLNGFLKTAITGALLGALYLTSESLIYVIILHFVIDISANYLLEEKKTEQPMGGIDCRF